MEILNGNDFHYGIDKQFSFFALLVFWLQTNRIIGKQLHASIPAMSQNQSVSVSNSFPFAVDIAKYKQNRPDAILTLLYL